MATNQEEIEYANACKLSRIILNVGTASLKSRLEFDLVYKFKKTFDQVYEEIFRNQSNEYFRGIVRALRANDIDNMHKNWPNNFDLFDISALYAISLNIFRKEFSNYQYDIRHIETLKNIRNEYFAHLNFFKCDNFRFVSTVETLKLALGQISINPNEDLKEIDRIVGLDCISAREMWQTMMGVIEGVEGLSLKQDEVRKETHEFKEKILKNNRELGDEFTQCVNKALENLASQISENANKVMERVDTKIDYLAMKLDKLENNKFSFNSFFNNQQLPKSFLKRDMLLRQIEERESSGSLIVVHGQAGFGKSSIVLYFAREVFCKREAAVALWLNAETEEKVISDYREILRRSGRCLEPSWRKEVLKSEFENLILEKRKERKILLIFDNVENFNKNEIGIESFVCELLGSNDGSVKVILTLRSAEQVLNGFNLDFQRVEMNTFSKEEFTEYFYAKSGDNVKRILAVKENKSRSASDFLDSLFDLLNEQLSPFNINKLVFLTVQQVKRGKPIGEVVSGLKENTEQIFNLNFYQKLVDSYSTSEQDKRLIELILYSLAHLDPDHIEVKFFNEIIKCGEEQEDEEVLSYLEKSFLMQRLVGEEELCFIKVHRLSQLEMRQFLLVTKSFSKPAANDLNLNIVRTIVRLYPETTEFTVFVDSKKIVNHGLLALRLFQFDKFDQDFEKLSLGIASYYEMVLHEYEKALQIYTDLREKRRNRNDDELSYEVAFIITSMAIALAKLVKYPESIEKFEEALKIKRRLVDRSVELGIDLSYMGGVYTNMGDYGNALKCFKEALDIELRIFKQQENEGKSSNLNYFHISAGLNNVGGVLLHIGKSETALKYFEEALEMQRTLYREKGGERGQTEAALASSLNNIAEVYQAKGEFRRALECLHEALAINISLFKEADSLSIAASLSNIGYLYGKMNDFQNSLDYHGKALEMRRRIFKDKESLELAMSLNCVGEVYGRAENYEEALKCFSETLEMRMRLFKGADSAEIATSLNNIGLNYDCTGEYDLALKYLKDSLEMSRRTFKQTDNQSQVISLSNIAMVYKNKGEYEQSLEYLSESLEMLKRIHFDYEKHPSISKCLENIVFLLGLIVSKWNVPTACTHR